LSLGPASHPDKAPPMPDGGRSRAARCTDRPVASGELPRPLSEQHRRAHEPLHPARSDSCARHTGVVRILQILLLSFRIRLSWSPVAVRN
jgi:hypothetical protein